MCTVKSQLTFGWLNLKDVFHWRNQYSVVFSGCCCFSSWCMYIYEWVCSLSVPAGWTSPTRPCRLAQCLLADAPHSDMCVPAHLFRPHYCQACVNKYPGVERSSVPVLHHQWSSVCWAPPPLLQQGWQEPWLHCKHCSYSPSAQTPTLHSILCADTDAPTRTAYTRTPPPGTHTDKQILTHICSFTPIIFLFTGSIGVQQTRIVLGHLLWSTAPTATCDIYTDSDNYFILKSSVCHWYDCWYNNGWNVILNHFASLYRE